MTNSYSVAVSGGRSGEGPRRKQTSMGPQCKTPALSPVWRKVSCCSYWKSDWSLTYQYWGNTQLNNNKRARLWNCCSLGLQTASLSSRTSCYAAHWVLDGTSSSFETLCVMRVALLQNISAFQGSFLHAQVLLPSLSLPRPPEGRPPPIQDEETGVLSPSRSTSTANLPGRWQPECDKSICPGLNLYANLK